MYSSTELLVGAFHAEADHARHHVLPALAGQAHRGAALGRMARAAQLLDLGLAGAVGQLRLGRRLARRHDEQQRETGGQ
jgi:hypothetical protein